MTFSYHFFKLIDKISDLKSTFYIDLSVNRTIKISTIVKLQTDFKDFHLI